MACNLTQGQLAVVKWWGVKWLLVAEESGCGSRVTFKYE